MHVCCISDLLFA